jgi:signal transduction histidine kinase
MSAPRHVVLLVEDNPGDAFIASERLAEGPGSGFDVVHVKRLEEAAQALSSRAVDAVILDLNLPDSQGLPSLERVLSISGSAPVIVVSSSMSLDLRGQVLGSGASEVFAKDESNSRLFSRSVLYAIERNRAREQHKQIEMLLEATPDAILVVTVTGIVRYVNQAALQLFDRRREDFVGELLGFSVKDGEPIDITIHRRGEARICEMRVASFDWQGELAFLASIRDQTALQNSRREAIEKQQLSEHRALQLSQILGGITSLARRLGLSDVGDAPFPVLNARPDEHLSDAVLQSMLAPFETAFRGYVDANRKLAAQNRELADAKAAIEVVNRELEAFSYSVAHDLRAPLRGIDGFSRALLEDAGDKLDDDALRHLQKIRKCAHRMEQIIHDLLELSRVTRAELSRSSVDLVDLARGIAGHLAEAHPERDVELLLPSELVAYVDRNLMRSLLENLLANAYKFTAKTERPRVELGVVRDGGEDVYFVRDNGVGFDNAYAHKLFGVFQRLHSNDEFEGTGVGLSIVKRIVERHGGRVWAEGNTGEGAAFYFALGSAEDR